MPGQATTYSAIIQFIVKRVNEATREIKAMGREIASLDKTKKTSADLDRMLSRNVLGYGRSLDEAIIRVGKYAVALRILQFTIGTITTAFGNFIRLQDQLLDLRKALPITTDFNKFTFWGLDEWFLNLRNSHNVRNL